MATKKKAPKRHAAPVTKKTGRHAAPAKAPRHRARVTGAKLTMG